MKRKGRSPTRRGIAKGGRHRAKTVTPRRLLGDIRDLIEQSRRQVAQTVNAAMVWLYWNIGKRIREDVLHERRAGYGEEIVSSLSAQLTAEYGRGFSRQNLFRMIRFAEVFPDGGIVSSLMRQLSWTLRHLNSARRKSRRPANQPSANAGSLHEWPHATTDKGTIMQPVEVRKELVDALRLDLIGPCAVRDLGTPDEVLPQAPSRWYLTGSLVPLGAAEKMKGRGQAKSSPGQRGLFGQ